MPAGFDPALLQLKQNIRIKDHENDTEDIPQNLEPMEIHLRDEDGGWLDPNQIQLHNEQVEATKHKWDCMYEQEDDDKSYELVQFDHENDTEDMPEGQNPYGFDFIQQRSNGKSIGELVQTQAQLSYDPSDVVLMRYNVDRHINDTDDIVVELNEEKNYDNKHSKKWNQQVATEEKVIEKQLAQSDLNEKEQEQLKQQTEIRTQLEYQRQVAEEQLRRQQMMAAQQEQQHHVQKSTVIETKNNSLNLNEVYGGMKATVDSDTKAYQV
jgi:hypothetical protein